MTSDQTPSKPSTSGTVCVVGLGKIGLPLAVQYAGNGFDVIGADIDPNVVDQVNRGAVPFPGEYQLDQRLSAAVGAGRLTATTDTAGAAALADIVVVVVPLIVDPSGSPDFRHLDAATAAIGSGITAGTLVVYETTVPVHTTRRRFAPALADASRLVLGEELFIAFSPERVYSGRIFADLRRYPKLVGGIDEVSTRRAIQFYELALDFDDRPDLDRANGVWDLGSAEAAELAKLAETTYRDINIAFANELAIFAEGSGIDVFQVIGAANSQPFSHIHGPGIAVGGHCIPVYPRLFLATATESILPVASRDVNEAVPAHNVARLERALGTLDGMSILILGLAYRGGVKETAFSGAFPLAAELERRGATVTVHDPLFTDREIEGWGLRPADPGARHDAAIIQADHAEYRSLRPADLAGIRVLLDGRHITSAEDWTSAGIRHLQLGRPESSAASTAPGRTTT